MLKLELNKFEYFNASELRQLNQQKINTVEDFLSANEIKALKGNTEPNKLIEFHDKLVAMLNSFNIEWYHLMNS